MGIGLHLSEDGLDKHTEKRNPSTEINLGKELEFRTSMMKLMHFIFVFQMTRQRSSGLIAHLIPPCFAEEN